ncbi:MAG: protein kinase [Polyangiales bacterium]
MAEDRETPNPPPREAPTPPRPGALGPGAVFSDRYRLVRRLGSGGMAEVFEVEHLLTKRHLALKLLHPESLGNPTSVERFYREASACAGIDSDHIVQIIDCDVDKTTAIPFLVMELLQGEDLAQYIAKRWEDGAGIPPTTVTALLKQVASALDKVHAQGIVHRDLKPANLFVTFPDDGPPRVKILDFGIAKHIHSDVSSTPSGRLGTPLYMAAEQVSHRAPISAQTDITAVALIAYELLVGRPYWHGLSAAAIFARVPDRAAHHPPSASASKHGVELPAGFDAWMLRCLDPDPARRPPSVSVAVGELLRVYDPRATQPPIGPAAPSEIVRPSRPTPARPATAVPAPRAPSLHLSEHPPHVERRLAPRASTRPRATGPTILRRRSPATSPTRRQRPRRPAPTSPSPRPAARRRRGERDHGDEAPPRALAAATSRRRPRRGALHRAHAKAPRVASAR